MKNKRLAILGIVLMLAMACNMPSAVATAVVPSPTVPSADQSPTAAVVAAASATSSIPLASPNGQPVNCRSGPGTGWPVVVLLNPGQSAEIVGRNADSSWLYVKNPLTPGTFCWMSAAFVLTSGDLSGVAFQPDPPTPLAPPTPAPGKAVVTNVTVSISPETIHVGGCMGPIQPSTITATVSVNGGTKLSWHFVTDQKGALPIHSLNFNKAGDKDISATFTPPLDEGTYKVWIEIDGMDLSGMDTTATYEIDC